MYYKEKENTNLQNNMENIQLQLCMCMLSVGREEKVNTEIRVVKLLKIQCMVKLQVIRLFFMEETIKKIKENLNRVHNY